MEMIMLDSLTGDAFHLYMRQNIDQNVPILSH